MGRGDTSMREISQSALQTLYRSFPHAYFLIDTVMHRADSQDWDSITENVAVVDEERLNQHVHRQVQLADRERLEAHEGDKAYAARYQQGHKFAFRSYKQVQAEVAPTSFLCRRCGYIASLKRK